MLFILLLCLLACMAVGLAMLDLPVRTQHISDPPATGHSAGGEPDLPSDFLVSYPKPLWGSDAGPGSWPATI